MTYVFGVTLTMDVTVEGFDSKVVFCSSQQFSPLASGESRAVTELMVFTGTDMKEPQKDVAEA